ncbi:TPA: TcdA/TcdB catalytic glycosyltransferase domain-containing protein, partial [Vibrio vulnificus]
ELDNVFYDERLRRMYFKELTLRHNAACASDILRLSLLYRDGGMYVDVDTLPSHQAVYTGLTLRHGAINENIIDILKSEYLLREVRKIKKYSAKRNVCVAKIEEQVGNPEFIEALKNQAANGVEALFSQHPVCAHRDIMKIATINRYYEVNNNVLIAHKGSRTTRIVLREMSRRYKYLESNNLLFSTQSTKRKVDGYLARLDRYRFDSITLTEGTDVTLILTGPCLIHEVLLGLLYEVCHLPKSTSPFSVSYLFRIERSFLGFRHQVNYTPEHMRSSWM